MVWGRTPDRVIFRSLPPGWGLGPRGQTLSQLLARQHAMADPAQQAEASQQQQGGMGNMGAMGNPMSNMLALQNQNPMNPRCR